MFDWLRRTFLGEDNSGSGYQQAASYDRQPPQDDAPYLATLQRLLQENIANSKAERETQDKNYRISKATVWWLRIYTVVTAGIALLTYCQVRSNQDQGAFLNSQLGAMREQAGAAQIAANAAKTQADAALTANKTSYDALIANSRAWISPVFVKLDRPVEQGTPLEFTIAYLNVGREPATGFKYKRDMGAIPNIPRIVDVSTIHIPENHSCDGLLPSADGQIAYPNLNPTGGYTQQDNAFYESTIRTDFQNIVDQNAIFYINGCFAYRTLGQPHTSGFCFFLWPVAGHTSNDWKFGTCPTGNKAT